MGRTDRNGRALLPNLAPYYEQHIYIDPATLPDGWEPAETERVAVAGYRQGAIVDFGARLVHGAVLVLHRKDGTPVAPGYVAQLEGGEDAIVGYDGQIYVRGLAAHNRIRVDFGSAGTCAADFDYDVEGPAQPLIGPLTCQ
jgi:outer membrane usher protein